MTKEIRRIIFDNSELTHAIESYGSRFGLRFPKGKVVRTRNAGTAEYQGQQMEKFHTELHRDYNVVEQPHSVILTFFEEKTFENKYYDIRADFISGALVAYCVENKILLPKAGKKHLGFSDLNLSLDIEYESESPDKEPSLMFEEDT